MMAPPQPGMQMAPVPGFFILPPGAPMPPPHVATQAYAQGYPPLQVPIASSSSKRVRAVPIVDPKTRKVLGNPIPLNTNVPDFVPGSKRNDQQER